MNSNIEYEKFTQEVYQALVNTDVVKTTLVQHNVKLVGKSGQKHQIDVYWEYEIAGVIQRVAIECKNYNRPVPVGKIRDFYGVLSDLNNVVGIMVTKVGYQNGAKEFATHYGIGLKELRSPLQGEAIIGNVELNINASIRHCLFLIDEQYAKKQNLNISLYKHFLDSMDFNRKKKWGSATHIPLEIADRYIRDAKGQIISSFDDLEMENSDSESDIVYNFADTYVYTRNWGLIKIKEIKYEFENINQNTTIFIDAQDFVKAILKDVITNETKLIG